jgi:hypothetical protein
MPAASSNIAILTVQKKTEWRMQKCMNVHNAEKQRTVQVRGQLEMGDL